MLSFAHAAVAPSMPSLKRRSGLGIVLLATLLLTGCQSSRCGCACRQTRVSNGGQVRESRAQRPIGVCRAARQVVKSDRTRQGPLNQMVKRTSFVDESKIVPATAWNSRAARATTKSLDARIAQVQFETDRESNRAADRASDRAGGVALQERYLEQDYLFPDDEPLMSADGTPYQQSRRIQLTGSESPALRVENWELPRISDDAETQLR